VVEKRGGPVICIFKARQRRVNMVPVSDYPSVNRSIGSDPAACMAWSCHVVLAQNELFLSDLRGWKDEARLLSILREAP